MNPAKTIDENSSGVFSASIWQFNDLPSLLWNGYSVLDAFVEAGYYNQLDGTNRCKRCLQKPPGMILKMKQQLHYALIRAANRFESGNNTTLSICYKTT